jgi:hypothetical protein
MSIHATGNMKRISFINGTFYLIALPTIYLFLINGFPPITAFIIDGIIVLAGSYSNLITLNKYIEFSIKSFLKVV